MPEYQVNFKMPDGFDKSNYKTYAKYPDNQKQTEPLSIDKDNNFSLGAMNVYVYVEVYKQPELGDKLKYLGWHVPVFGSRKGDPVVLYAERDHLHEMATDNNWVYKFVLSGSSTSNSINSVDVLLMEDVSYPEHWDEFYLDVNPDFLEKFDTRHNDDNLNQVSYKVNEWEVLYSKYRLKPVEVTIKAIKQGTFKDSKIFGSGVDIEGNPVALEAEGTPTRIDLKWDNKEVGRVKWDVIFDGETPDPDPVDKYDAIDNFYLMTPEDMKKFNHSGAWLDISSGTEQNLSGYLLGVYELPFKISEEFYSVKRPILLGKWNPAYMHDYPVQTLKGELYKLPLGEVVIPEKYGNGLDLLASIDVRLPFTDSVISLDSGMVLGKKLRFEYVVSMTDATATINAYDGDDLIYTGGVTVGREIPLKGKWDLYNSLTSADVTNDLRALKVHVKRPLVEKSQFSNLVNKEGSLIIESGFIMVDEFELVTSAYSDEKRMIENLMKQGVIIND